MTSSDSWLSHYSFRLRKMTPDSPEEGLDGSFRWMAQELATYENTSEVHERQIPAIPQANILFTTGWVDWVTVRETFGAIQITEVFTYGTETFIIWQGGLPSAADSPKVSLLREALAKDLPIDIFHEVSSALINQLTVYSHGPKRQLPLDVS